MNNKKKKCSLIIILLALVCVCIIYYYLQIKKGPSAEPYIKLYLHEQNKVIKIKLEDYIKGTVAAEMPASFSMEALKAQAVCARTYAIKKLIQHASYPKGADLSDDINTCQAYTSLQNYAPNNSSRRELLKRINEAVNSTRGEIILYNSEPIDALYCSTCGGETESAGAVWGKDIPYLQPVKCGYCEDSDHYKNSQTVDNHIINNLVGDKGDILDIKILSHTPGGRPNIISINNHQLDSGTLRKKLNLPSNWIEFHPSARSTIIDIRGYGHGVGLCQYGADGMARQNKDYHQILKKYYQGIDFYNMAY